MKPYWEYIESLTYTFIFVGLFMSLISSCKKLGSKCNKILDGIVDEQIKHLIPLEYKVKEYAEEKLQRPVEIKELHRMIKEIKKNDIPQEQWDKVVLEQKKKYL